eukprot:TRINITY_DN6771_c0_g1_i1.p1 TRINITY_DN6771_c0_g1~~TRINITY_DN6771_c0_g1_i1.p1  ORF type:complete len:227 (+),score=69.71 TRINITY_DN6771_c0_g1_i1:55-735(+)
MMFRTAALLAAVTCVAAQPPIPNKLSDLGWLMTGNDTRPQTEPLEIEVFGDFQCPDTRDAWNNILFPLLQWLKGKENAVTIIYHPFPLPYHYNSFQSVMVADVGVRLVVDDLKVDRQTAFEKVATELFKYQDNFQNNATNDMTQPQIWKQVFWPILLAAGVSPSHESVFLQQQTNANLNQNVRVPWKFGCSITVSGTPMYFINRVVSYDAASWSLTQWQQFILSHS